MKRHLIVLPLLLIALGTAPRAGAWSFAHAVVAHIAHQHLTPKTRAVLDGYLDGSIVEYARWMDRYRKSPEYGERYPESGGWNPQYGYSFIWHMDSGDENFRPTRDPFDKTRRPDGAGTASAGAQYLYDILCKYKELDDSTVVVAIKMLSHVVGDMHCPAHAYFAKMPPRKPGSKSGYSSSYGFFDLYYKGKKTSYHAIWDAALERVHRGLGQKVGRYTELIDKDITPEYRKEILKGMPYDWACDNLPRAWKIYEWAKPGDRLDENFYQEHGAYVDDQVLRGGYRLAKLLNLAFDENYHGE